MKKKAKNMVLGAIWCIAAIAVIIAVSMPSNKSSDVVDSSIFMEKAEVTVNEAKVGAKVTLKEVIHGTGGLTYRYIIKTDCPSWDFETRYTDSQPIPWATDDTASAETLIYDTQVRFEGAVYASGQYYTIPILGGISSETVSLDEWKENLLSQAYQTYVADMASSYGFVRQSVIGIGTWVMVLLGAYLLITIYIEKEIRKKMEKEG